jgi:membrane associated rhomboid family serine protease
MAAADSPLLRFRLWRAALPPALRLLLTVNVATYVAFVLLSIPNLGGVMREWLALPLGLDATLFRPWTILTYGFTNAYPGFFGLLTFVFGALWLNWLGRDYEETYGSHRLFGLYVVGVLGGAALAAVFSAVVTGASGFGAWCGIWAPLLAVLCCVAVLHPDRGIGLFLIGVVPLKWIAIVFVVLELAFSKDPTHLGAALTGALFGFGQKRGVDLAAWARPLFERRRAAASGRGGRSAGPSVGDRVKRAFAREEAEAPPPRAGRGPAPRPRPERRPRPGPAGQDEVDRILDKIIESGFEALTDEERRILDEASRRS